MTLLQDEPVVEEAPVDEPSAASPALVCASALLAASAFGWVAGSVFSGLLGRAVGVLGAVLGVAVVYASTRVRRPSPVQYAGAGLAVLVGALLVLPFTGEGASLPSLVTEALRSGGLGQPPVAFDPGWRFVLLVTAALLGEACAALALSLDRPRAAPVLVLPFVVGAALLQPPETEVTATLVGLLLLVASLAVSFGDEVGGDSGFQVRRLARGAVALVALGGVLLGTSQLGFLFPPPSAEAVVPPMRPPAPPPARDRVLFTVEADRPTTWRLGTLDVYRETAWLTPPFDVSALVPVDGPVPTDAPGETRGPVPAETLRARITLADLPGKALPGLANPVAVNGGPQVQYDPRTQALRTGGTRPPSGTSYEVVAAAPPSGELLSRAGAPGPAVRPFLEAPPAPQEVAALLASAPVEPFARLQAVRQAYFAKVVAAGSGDPVDVPPSRVAEMLAGREATPYEITAGEVLLARWAGLPARLGYGWFGGDEKGDRTWEIRPKHGATWLEVHVEGAGWVPIVGTPPRAKASTSAGERNDDPSVRPTDELALVVYVPVRLSSVRLVYVLVRYYVLAALPWLLAVVAVAVGYPALVKLARRTARRRAALRLGPRARIAAAYAELRDAVTDLRIAGPAVSPLELLDRVAPDAEHRELAWLVTRSLWGDLQRDLRQEDVDAAEAMSRSVTKRLRTAQPGLTRATALVSRASLHEPWTRELPTLWPARAPRTAARRLPLRRRVTRRLRALPTAVRALPAAVRALPARVRALPAGARSLPSRVRTGPLLVSGTALVLVAVVLVALTRPEPVPPAAAPLPAQVAPAALDDVRFVRERDAEAAFRDSTGGSLAVEGRVFSVRQGDVVQASLQVAQLAPDVDTRSPRVRDQVLSSFGGGRFRPVRVGEERVFRLDQPGQTLLLHFTPDGRGYSLMAAREQFDDGARVFASVLAFRRGEQAQRLRPADVPVPDPRRGSAS